MVDQTPLTLMDKLDRIFHRDDVVFAVFIRVIHDGCQGRRLSASRRAGYEYQSLVKHRELLHDRWHAELFGCQDGRWNLAEYGSNTIFLIEKVRPEPRDARNFVPEIDV